MAQESQSEPSAGAPGPDLIEVADPIEAAAPADFRTRNSLSTLVEQKPGGSGHRWKRRVTIAAGLLALLAAGLVLPPLINISRYQRQITALMTRSMGRSVRMSAVELRLLPSPGFVLHDLAVSEDPAFGAEPILSARTVVASVRLFSLWRGRLEIREVSVDEASLNLVRSPQGRWNLESLLMGAQPAGQNGAANGGGNDANLAKISARFPYLSATNSRVNFKNGAEKSPFSLAGTDLSLWQDNPGQWRVRLLGQPVRTDLPMSLADTGEVRMEASFQSAAQLREMPMKIQMEWRNAQLGQLSRLILGSDAGWRGDLTADIDMQGTPEAAETKARLRATGVRRQEFVPETSLDFDANCTFRYQHSRTAFHDVGCDTAIGDGRLHLKAEVPGRGSETDPAIAPEAMLEVHQVPVQAALDLLRTVRSGFAPGISAKGTANGSLRYKELSPTELPKAPLPKAITAHTRKAAGKLEQSSEASSLQGSLTITGAELSGGKLHAALKLPEITLIPAQIRQIAGQTAGLGGRASVGSAGRAGQESTAPISVQNRAKLVGLFTVPLTSVAGSSLPVSSESAVPAGAQTASVQLFLDQHGYQVQITGTAAVERLRELAYGFGWPSSPASDGFHGGTADFSFASQGAWVADANGDLSLQEKDASEPDSRSGGLSQAASDKGTELTLHHTEWQANYLAHPVKLVLATAGFVGSKLRFSGDFTYGPIPNLTQNLAPNSVKDSDKDSGKDVAKDALRGNLAVTADTDCTAIEAGVSRGEQGVDSAANDAERACLPKIELRFGALDAALVEAAMEPTPAEKSVFSPLTDRISPSDQPKMPGAEVSVQADSLVLGPVTLQKPAMHLRLRGNAMEIADWEAQLLGGSAKGTGHIGWDSGKPEYEFYADFTGLNGTTVGTLLDTRWAAGAMDGGGHLTLSGLMPKDLVGSALGDVRFDWRHGSVVSAGGSPLGELRFDRWVGVGTIGSGKIKIDRNTVVAGQRRYSVEGSIPLGGPAKLTLNPDQNRGQDLDHLPKLTPVAGDANGKTAPVEPKK